jgi:probable phosphoglycerate mutase
VIRHGQTDWNAACRLQGRENVPLNETGRAQARRNGRALYTRLAAAGQSAADYDFVSSPMLRATQTMTLLREEMRLAPLAFRQDDRLMELDFGRWSGLYIDDIIEHQSDEYAARAADRWNHRPPGGESHADALERVLPFFAALDRPTVIVAHGGINRVTSVLLGAIDPAGAPDFPAPQDRFFVWSGAGLTWV